MGRKANISVKRAPIDQPESSVSAKKLCPEDKGLTRLAQASLLRREWIVGTRNELSRLIDQQLGSQEKTFLLGILVGILVVFLPRLILTIGLGRVVLVGCLLYSARLHYEVNSLKSELEAFRENKKATKEQEAPSVTPHRPPHPHLSAQELHAPRSEKPSQHLFEMSSSSIPRPKVPYTDSSSDEKGATPGSIPKNEDALVDKGSYSFLSWAMAKDKVPTFDGNNITEFLDDCEDISYYHRGGFSGKRAVLREAVRKADRGVKFTVREILDAAKNWEDAKKQLLESFRSDDALQLGGYEDEYAKHLEKKAPKNWTELNQWLRTWRVLASKCGSAVISEERKRQDLWTVLSKDHVDRIKMIKHCTNAELKAMTADQLVKAMMATIAEEVETDMQDQRYYGTSYTTPARRMADQPVSTRSFAPERPATPPPAKHVTIDSPLKTASQHEEPNTDDKMDKLISSMEKLTLFFMQGRGTDDVHRLPHLNALRTRPQFRCWYCGHEHDRGKCQIQANIESHGFAVYHRGRIVITFGFDEQDIDKRLDVSRSWTRYLTDNKIPFLDFIIAMYTLYEIPGSRAYERAAKRIDFPNPSTEAQAVAREFYEDIHKLWDEEKARGFARNRRRPIFSKKEPEIAATNFVEAYSFEDKTTPEQWFVTEESSAGPLDEEDAHVLMAGAYKRQRVTIEEPSRTSLDQGREQETGMPPTDQPIPAKTNPADIPASNETAKRPQLPDPPRIPVESAIVQRMMDSTIKMSIQELVSFPGIQDLIHRKISDVPDGIRTHYLPGKPISKEEARQQGERNQNPTARYLEAVPDPVINSSQCVLANPDKVPNPKVNWDGDWARDILRNGLPHIRMISAATEDDDQWDSAPRDPRAFTLNFFTPENIGPIQRSPYIRVKIGAGTNKDIIGVIDTGAELSTICESYVIANKIVYERSKVACQAFNRSRPLELRGRANTTLWLGGREINLKVFVAEDSQVTVPLLLGMPFIRASKFTFNHDDNSGLVRGEMIIGGARLVVPLLDSPTLVSKEGNEIRGS